MRDDNSTEKAEQYSSQKGCESKSRQWMAKETYWGWTACASSLIVLCCITRLPNTACRPLSAEEKSAYRCEWIVHGDDALASGDQTLGSHIIDTVLPVDRIHHNDMTGDLLLQYVTSSRQEPTLKTDWGLM
eukprot:scpid94625/ scgid0328/ 